MTDFYPFGSKRRLWLLKDRYPRMEYLESERKWGFPDGPPQRGTPPQKLPKGPLGHGGRRCSYYENPPGLSPKLSKIYLLERFFPLQLPYFSRPCPGDDPPVKTWPDYWMKLIWDPPSNAEWYRTALLHYLQVPFWHRLEFYPLVPPNWEDPEDPIRYIPGKVENQQREISHRHSAFGEFGFWIEYLLGGAWDWLQEWAERILKEWDPEKEVRTPKGGLRVEWVEDTLRACVVAGWLEKGRDIWEFVKARAPRRKWGMWVQYFGALLEGDREKILQCIQGVLPKRSGGSDFWGYCRDALIMAIWAKRYLNLTIPPDAPWRKKRISRKAFDIPIPLADNCYLAQAQDFDLFPDCFFEELPVERRRVYNELYLWRHWMDNRRWELPRKVALRYGKKALLSFLQNPPQKVFFNKRSDVYGEYPIDEKGRRIPNCSLPELGSLYGFDSDPTVGLWFLCQFFEIEEKFRREIIPPITLIHSHLPPFPFLRDWEILSRGLWRFLESYYKAYLEWFVSRPPFKPYGILAKAWELVSSMSSESFFDMRPSSLEDIPFKLDTSTLSRWEKALIRALIIKDQELISFILRRLEEGWEWERKQYKEEWAKEACYLRFPSATKVEHIRLRKQELVQALVYDDRERFLQALSLLLKTEPIWEDDQCKVASYEILDSSVYEAIFFAILAKMLKSWEIPPDLPNRHRGPLLIPAHIFENLTYEGLLSSVQWLQKYGFPYRKGFFRFPGTVDLIPSVFLEPASDDCPIEEAPQEWLELENFRFVQEWLAKEERCEKRFGVEFSPPRKILRKSSKILYLDLLKKWIRKKGTSS